MGEQLNALASQECPHPWELVVADNGSTDSSLEIVESFRDQIQRLVVVSASDKKGVAYARNIGLEASEGEVILHCDADDVVGDGWIEALSAALEENQLAAGRLEVEELNSGTWLKQRRAPQTRGLQERDPELRHSASSNLGFRRDVYDMVGRFDEDLPGFSDTDFCWRAAEVGAELVWVPEAVVHYRYRDSLLGVYRQARTYATARAALKRKHGVPSVDRTVWRNVAALLRVVVGTVPDLLRAGPARVAWKWGSYRGRVSSA